MKNKFNFLLIVIAMIIATVPFMHAMAEEAKVRAFLVVGTIKARLSVMQRFGDFLGTLPEPGILEDKDGHSHRHDSHTYCYVYQTAKGIASLEIYDSDFGMHTAQISHDSHEKHSTCAKLESEPYFLVNEQLYSLSSKTFNAPPDFESSNKEGTLQFEYTYNYIHADGKQFCGSPSIVIKSKNKKIRSIMVQNWTEPGSC